MLQYVINIFDYVFVLKDEATKRQAEVNKIREVLIIQDVLSLLEDEDVRQDFVKEQNGACKVEQSELEVLDKL